eukprot:6955656-Prymnesium_polylepis.5
MVPWMLLVLFLISNMAARPAPSAELDDDPPSNRTLRIGHNDCINVRRVSVGSQQQHRSSGEQHRSSGEQQRSSGDPPRTSEVRSTDPTQLRSFCGRSNNPLYASNTSADALNDALRRLSSEANFPGPRQNPATKSTSSPALPHF